MPDRKRMQPETSIAHCIAASCAVIYGAAMRFMGGCGRLSAMAALFVIGALCYAAPSEGSVFHDGDFLHALDPGHKTERPASAPEKPSESAVIPPAPRQKPDQKGEREASNEAAPENDVQIFPMKVRDRREDRDPGMAPSAVYDENIPAVPRPPRPSAADLAGTTGYFSPVKTSSDEERARSQRTAFETIQISDQDQAGAPDVPAVPPARVYARPLRREPATGDAILDNVRMPDRDEVLARVTEIEALADALDQKRTGRAPSSSSSPARQNPAPRSTSERPAQNAMVVPPALPSRKTANRSKNTDRNDD